MRETTVLFLHKIIASQLSVIGCLLLLHNENILITGVKGVCGTIQKGRLGFHLHVASGTDLLGDDHDAPK